MKQAAALINAKLHIIDKAKKVARESTGHVLIVGKIDIATQEFDDFFHFQQGFLPHAWRDLQSGDGVVVGRRALAAYTVRFIWAGGQLAIGQSGGRTGF